MHKAIITAVVLVGAGLFMLQGFTINKLKQEIQALRSGHSEEPLAELAGPAPAESQARSPSDNSNDPRLTKRIAELEQRLAELTRTSDYLMERGQVPLAGAKAESVMLAFSSADTPEMERVQALRLLRRNNMFTDEVAAMAASMLPTLTDPRARREMLDQLGGATNEVLKATFQQLARNDSDEDVRERAVQRLGRFAISDPQARNDLWDVLTNDKEASVRQEAQNMLSRLPTNDAGIADARARGTAAGSSVETRLAALSILQNAKQDASGIAATLASLAMSSPDQETRHRLLRSFDNISHPSFMEPLVLSLQDSNAEIRREAADALSSFRTDPTVSEWLSHLAQNDSDPRVRREAMGALNEGQPGGGRRERGGGRGQ